MRQVLGIVPGSENETQGKELWIGMAEWSGARYERVEGRGRLCLTVIATVTLCSLQMLMGKNETGK